MYTIVFLSVLCVAQPKAVAEREKDVTVINPVDISWAFGKYFELGVRRADIDSAAKWLAADNPPLPAKRAMRAAEQAVAKMEAEAKDWTNVWTRQTSQITLYPFGEGRWLWIVTYHWIPQRAGFSGRPPQLSVAVTMDGKAIAPVPINDEKLYIRPPGT